jgi:hypothetical protein
MKITPRKRVERNNARSSPYKKTPFDKEERLRISFDIDESMTLRERQDQESRRKLFMHRWQEEQENKHRQLRQSKKWQRHNAKLNETWRDVVKEHAKMGPV